MSEKKREKKVTLKVPHNLGDVVSDLKKKKRWSKAAAPHSWEAASSNFWHLFLEYYLLMMNNQLAYLSRAQVLY